jgi:hypothetical protein
MVDAIAARNPAPPVAPPPVEPPPPQIITDPLTQFGTGASNLNPVTTAPPMTPATGAAIPPASSDPAVVAAASPAAPSAPTAPVAAPAPVAGPDSGGGYWPAGFDKLPADVQNAYLTQVRSLLMGFGSQEMARKILGANDPSIAGISDAPGGMSTLAQLHRGYDQNVHNTDESLNRSNLFYSGYRGTQDANLAYNYGLGRFNAEQALQKALDAITGSELTAIGKNPATPAPAGGTGAGTTTPPGAGGDTTGNPTTWTTTPGNKFKPVPETVIPPKTGAGGGGPTTTGAGAPGPGPPTIITGPAPGHGPQTAPIPPPDAHGPQTAPIPPPAGHSTAPNPPTIDPLAASIVGYGLAPPALQGTDEVAPHYGPIPPLPPLPPTTPSHAVAPLPPPLPPTTPSHAVAPLPPLPGTTTRHRGL